MQDISNFDLRIIHAGGDYGNFLSWALAWLNDPEYENIENILTDNGSAHRHIENFIHRDFDQDNQLVDYELRNHSDNGILRLHYNFNNVEKDIISLADIGPTVVIDPTNCLLETFNNRQEKMPNGSYKKINGVADLSAELTAFTHIIDTINKLNHSNLYVIKMKQLIGRPKQTILDCYNWWTNQQTPANQNNFDQALLYWQNKQRFLSCDDKLMSQFRLSHKELRSSIQPGWHDKLQELASSYVTTTSIDNIVNNQCRYPIISDSLEFEKFQQLPSLKNLYNLIHVVAGKNKEICKQIYQQAIGIDLNQYNAVVIHEGGDYGHWLMYMLQMICGAPVISCDKALNNDGSCHGHEVNYIHWQYTEQFDNVTKSWRNGNNFVPSFLRLHSMDQHFLNVKGVNNRDWLYYLKTQCKVIVIDGTNHELEMFLNHVTKTWKLWPGDDKKYLAEKHANYMFERSNALLNVTSDHELKKISVHDITQNLKETLQQLAQWLGLEISQPIDSIDSVIEYWANLQQFVNIDNEINQQHGVLASFVKHQTALQFVEDFFNDKQ